MRGVRGMWEMTQNTMLKINDITELAGIKRMAVLNQIKNGQLKATLNTSGVVSYWEATPEDVQAWLKIRRAKGRPRKANSSLQETVS